ncbi:endoplasmic reticulum metallopeptidase 1-like [Teleopsis dalmanni]|uniref:endoplasmic reticulum metallopeptidase 1-like n=1 Tax=Teleopsis dalmanni TaxID=139649 RepID=UPI0018CDC805|nr:endoplasmic reticulum metallopeptidase 1-like [Teleopsis dalmanni]
MGSREELVPITQCSHHSHASKCPESQTVQQADPTEKLPFRFAPTFLLFWFVLLAAVSVPMFLRLPEGLTLVEEYAHPNEFIAERAQRILYDLERIGPKIVGTYANENVTLQLLLDEVDKIRTVMNNDMFLMEVDVQRVSGQYMHWEMINMYQGVQNLVVKLSTRSSTSTSSLLINSHFDSKAGSPGTGDAGAMVVVMLETLRVLATSHVPFKHSIIFLFNGAEETPLQASHGFITQHKWAPSCKALINLDSAGSGNRELLFQSGPNHPWLMNTYRKHVKRPFATTMAEEVFHANLIPSDTDFRIFRDFGSLPGLDFAHSYNGYVYHTKFDTFDVIPRGNLQHTGENLLSLSRGFANAPEMENPELHSKGHTVFFDVMGKFFISYTETQGKIINLSVAVAAIILVVISILRIATASRAPSSDVWSQFLLIFMLHILGFVLAVVLPIIIATLYDMADLSMTWFTNKWLVIGLYVCPALFGLAAPTVFYLSLSNNQKIAHSYKLQMVMHAHCILLAIICILLTLYGIRSTYLPMLSLGFYVCALLLNLITTLHDQGYSWSILLIIGQLAPFFYFTFLIYELLCTVIPMTGRNGTAINPDLLIGILTLLGTVLSMGFIIHLISLFRRPKSALFLLIGVMIIFVIISLTPVGFPYRAKTSVGRVNFLHVRRVFYEYDGTVSRNESGYYFDFQDRRIHYPIENALDLSKLRVVTQDCEEHMMCGFPVFNHRWAKARNEGRWLPTEQPVHIPFTPTLTLLNRSVDDVARRVRYEFELKGSTHHSLFVQALDGVTITDWSFIRNMLEQPDKWQPPYHIFFDYCADDTPLKFYFELKKTSGSLDGPLFELGVSTHFVSFEHDRGAAGEEFIRSFPNYIHVMEWPSLYERHIF